jgi:hypothetical protein
LQITKAWPIRAVHVPVPMAEICGRRDHEIGPDGANATEHAPPCDVTTHSLFLCFPPHVDCVP